MCVCTCVHAHAHVCRCEQERIRGGGGERACNFRQECIGPVVQVKSLGRTKNRGLTVVSCGGRR